MKYFWLNIPVNTSKNVSDRMSFLIIIFVLVKGFLTREALASRVYVFSVSV
jgi:hypothetical protein